ncbi:class I SAM-dependent methyltransferase [Candidatus Woesearchaeota archaeon]|nr:class I SAM-dependent methyltransferase [Candidatus Woesearchaeota archaeon]
MRGSTVRSFYEQFDFERAISLPSPALKNLLDAEVEFLKRMIEPGRSVLEVGCGFGRLLIGICDRCRIVAGIDFSRSLLDKARQQLSIFNNTSLHEMDASSLSFSDESFRYTICMENTFGNMPGMELRVLSEMKRVTKKGGMIILSVFSEKARDMQVENYLMAGLTCIRDAGNAVTTNEGLFSRRFSKDEILRLFSSIGLDCSITSLCPENYVVVASRD